MEAPARLEPDGIDMHYVRHGSDYPLVLLQGWSGLTLPTMRSPTVREPLRGLAASRGTLTEHQRCFASPRLWRTWITSFSKAGQSG